MFRKLGMPRPRRPRRIHGPPRFHHFKPVGVPRRYLEAVTLTVDEYEAIRLADYEGMDQQPAADKMGISRPTFSRLIEAARTKLAQSIVEGKELLIEGGEIDYVHTLQRCSDCGEEQLDSLSPEEFAEEMMGQCCRRCGSENVEDLDEEALGPGYGKRNCRRRGSKNGNE
ncbi:DUF134 domain-containing protein [bacterium]|nr:DUF134 domain-containing protein [bacterium]